MDFQSVISMSLNFLMKSSVFLGTLSILVVLHELGHFIAARLSGVNVLEFSFGMGKILFKRKIRGTEYQVRAVPMGGFVKMAGEEKVVGEYDLKYGDFYFASPIKRLSIVLAGPFMNLFLALSAMTLVFFFNGETLLKPVTGYLAEDSIAFKQGLRSNDFIKAINNEPVTSFEEVFSLISSSAGEKVNLKVLRGEKEVEVEVIPELKETLDVLGDIYTFGDIGINPYQRPLIAGVLKNTPAERIGLAKGDIITKVAGENIFFEEDLLEKLQHNGAKKVAIEWLRDGELHKTSITPAIDDEQKKVKIGVMLNLDEMYSFHRDISFLNAVKVSGIRIYEITAITLRALKKMLSGKISKDNLMGPLRLASVVNDAAETGFLTWLFFLGFISHQLAIMNLLPFPALDGGHAIFFMIELVFRKAVNLKVQDICNRIGFTMLIGLFIFVLVNDLLYNFTH